MINYFVRAYRTLIGSMGEPEASEEWHEVIVLGRRGDTVRVYAPTVDSKEERYLHRDNLVEESKLRRGSTVVLLGEARPLKPQRDERVK